MFLVFTATCVKNVKSEDRLEKRADLEYDVLVKRKETKQVKSPAFESGIPHRKRRAKLSLEVRICI